jgi:protein MpaA
MPGAGDVLLGTSVEGRPIFAHRVGTGPRLIVLLGGIHGGYEANTVALVQALIAHFDVHSGDIPPEVSLMFVPAVNPDGLVRGNGPDGRFNARGVDLNRNWGCDWSADAVWRDQPVNAGASAFSEPETRVLAAFLRQTMPVAALFYHSAANGIFAGDCSRPVRESNSAQMTAIYGEAAGYRFGQAFTAYAVTGTASTWADGQGIASADVELTARDDIEFERNLQAVEAIMAWAAGRP